MTTPKLEFKDWALRNLERDLSMVETLSPVAESAKSGSIISGISIEAKSPESTEFPPIPPVSKSLPRRNELGSSVDNFAQAAQSPLLARIGELEKVIEEKDKEIAELKREVAKLSLALETKEAVF